MTAAVLMQRAWLVPPLALLARQLAPRDWTWYWLVAVERGLFTAWWAVLGASGLAAFPEYRASFWMLWVACPATAALGYLIARVEIPRAPAGWLHLRLHRKSRLGRPA